MFTPPTPMNSDRVFEFCCPIVRLISSIGKGAPTLNR